MSESNEVTLENWEEMFDEKIHYDETGIGSFGKFVIKGFYKSNSNPEEVDWDQVKEFIQHLLDLKEKEYTDNLTMLAKIKTKLVEEIDTSKIERVDIIEETGRKYLCSNPYNKVELNLQSDGTLKIYIKKSTYEHRNKP